MKLSLCAHGSMQREVRLASCSVGSNRQHELARVLQANDEGMNFPLLAN